MSNQLSDFSKSAVGVIGGGIGGLLIGITHAWISHMHCIAIDPNNYAAITISAITIPVFTYFGSLLGCVLADRYWFESPTVVHKTMHRKRPILRVWFLIRFAIVLSLVVIAIRIKVALFG